jgi:Na+/proline symporter
MIWSILAFSGVMFVGLFAVAFLSSTDPSNSINLIPLMAAQSLPAWLAALMIAGVLAAFITVGNSLLLAATSTIAEDIFHNHIYQNAVATKLISFSRITAVIVGLIALVIASLSKGSVISMASLAWAGLGASFGPGLLSTLWWRKTTREGVLAGMIVGTMTVIIWHFTPQLKGIVYELAPGFVFALLAVWFVSLATYNKRQIH